eukprot:4783861-Pyramimonas_sp.AAC.1
MLRLAEGVPVVPESSRPAARESSYGLRTGAPPNSVWIAPRGESVGTRGAAGGGVGGISRWRTS